MILNLAASDPPERLNADIVIVGSGPAGITLALSLRKAARSILLIESGGLEPDKRVQDMNKGGSVGQKYYPLHRSRSRYFGGSSNCWAGWCAPLDKSDFKKHSWIPESGWPIEYSDLATHYSAAESLLELNEKPFTPEPWIRKRAPIWSLGDEFETQVYKFSPPTRFGQVYREQLSDAPNIKCLLNATVTQINVTPNGEHVNNLTVVHSQGKRSVQVTGDTFVIAAGGIENARLLLASNQTLPQGVGNSNDVVGRYFMEHPHLHSEGRFYKTKEMPSIKLYTRHAYQGQIIKAYLRIPERLRSERQLLNLALCLEPVHRTVVSKDHKTIIDSTCETDGSQLLIGKNKQPKLMSCDLRAEQVPHRESRVYLGDEKDALGMRRAVLDWQLTELDKTSMRRTQQYFAKHLMIKGWSRFLFRLDETPTFPKRLKGGCHHMGTTRMSHSPKTGVVDKHLKVHGVDNLYVAGSSTFPTGGAANPTLSIVALSLRLAEHLKGVLVK